MLTENYTSIQQFFFSCLNIELVETNHEKTIFINVKHPHFCNEAQRNDWPSSDAEKLGFARC